MPFEGTPSEVITAWYVLITMALVTVVWEIWLYLKEIRTGWRRKEGSYGK